ncbi:MAG TPA: reverse transcriptase domain-containing protein [Candidatus Paceibacterota bacterium]|nr:reverse transcriptase domain-containing protein [Candidatus Paceibacterota bacterium]
MKTYKSLYKDVYSKSNLILAWRKARKGKTKRNYVIEFEKDVLGNLLQLYRELKNENYLPKSLETFILRDPKTRKISKADFRDRIVHHALINIIELIFDKTFIYDSCANRKGKGNLFALKRFDLFKRKVTNNLESEAFCLKADIKHYFEEVNHNVLINVITQRINDIKIVNLIKIILENGQKSKGIGMPLGNLTSQFFANVYLNELDYFAKHKLNVKYYIRYVDDFVILHNSKSQLEIWKEQINEFLNVELKLELHKDKSRIICLSRGIDFVGFRNYYYFRLLRKRNIKNMINKVSLFKNSEISKEKILESFQGWQAYAKWADSYKLINCLRLKINNVVN